MAFKELCKTLHTLTEKFEEELKVEINDLSNLVNIKNVGEVRSALENAKNYHYEEIFKIIGVFFKHIKEITFHVDKIEWLSDEANFSKEQLRRFSYVQRQIYAFSNSDSTTKSIPLKPTTALAKKIQRRSSSELSIGSLDAWENYMKLKEDEEKTVERQILQHHKPVIKRKASNIKTRKNLRSSTVDIFLDDKPNILEVIMEDGPRSTDCSSDDNEIDSEQNINEKSDPNQEIVNESSETTPVIETVNLNLIETEPDNKRIEDRISSASVLIRHDRSARSEEASSKSTGYTKPKIVDVVYKKKF